MHVSERIAADFTLSQIVQFLESALAAFPSLQAVHAVAPSAFPVENPEGHAMQSPVTAVGAYLPTVQSSHEDELKTNVPARL